MTKQKMIPILEWAGKHNVNKMVALMWARRSLIPAKKVSVRVKQWYVEQNAKPPKTRPVVRRVAG